MITQITGLSLQVKVVHCNISLWLTLPRFELNVVNGNIRTESRTCFLSIKQDLNNICYKIKGCQSISRKASIINKIKKKIQSVYLTKRWNSNSLIIIASLSIVLISRYIVHNHLDTKFK